MVFLEIKDIFASRYLASIHTIRSQYRPAVTERYVVFTDGCGLSLLSVLTSWRWDQKFLLIASLHSVYSVGLTVAVVDRGGAVVVVISPAGVGGSRLESE